MAAMANAATLRRGTLIPSAAAAVGSVRIACKARPKLERMPP